MPAATAFVGFDSAWADTPKALGAVCSILHDGDGFAEFDAPKLANFAMALAVVRARHRPETPTLVAIDQPTIVPNPRGMRPAERVAASVISWAGGGVQPANRGRCGLFDDDAPIWRFLQALGAVDDPRRARGARDGLFIMEVFPALAVLSFDDRFFGRLSAPRYNPARRRTFRPEHWLAVIDAATAEAHRLGCPPVARWLVRHRSAAKPCKSDQDRLDAVLCLLIAIRWRLAPPDQSIMLGDLENGYIMAPVTAGARQKLTAKAREIGVPISCG